MSGTKVLQSLQLLLDGQVETTRVLRDVCVPTSSHTQWLLRPSTRFLIFHDTETEQNGPVLLVASVVYRVHTQVPNQRPEGSAKEIHRCAGEGVKNARGLVSTKLARGCV